MLEPYLIVLQFDSLFQLLSGLVLVLLIFSYVKYLSIVKTQKDRIIKLEQLIKQLESKQNYNN